MVSKPVFENKAIGEQHQELCASTCFYVSDLKCPKSGHIRVSKKSKKIKTEFLRVDGLNSNVYNGLNLKHTNIAHCYSVYEEDSYAIFAFESFTHSLKSISNQSFKFWRYKNGKIIGGTIFLQNLVAGLLKAVTFIAKSNISHGQTSCLECIVFDPSNIPMLHDFSKSSVNDKEGLVKDIQGIGNLLLKLIPKDEYDTATHEVRSLVHLLQTYEATIDTMKLFDHPALLSPSAKMLLAIRARNMIKGKWNRHIRKDWLCFVQQSADYPTAYLGHWKRVGTESSNIDVRNQVARLCSNGIPEYKDSPDYLLKYVKDLYGHVNDNKPVGYSEEEVEDIVKDLYPNLYVEWYFFDQRIDAKFKSYM